MSIVKLLECTPNAEKLVAAAAKLCYSCDDPVSLYQNLNEEKIASFIEKLSKSGHLSPFEHVTFTFGIFEISRACSHQLVRHRTGIAFSQQSQRYVEGAGEVIIPPSIGCKDDMVVGGYLDVINKITDSYYDLIDNYNIPPEDARYLLPNASETAMVITINARELLHIASLRLCKRAQWEIREVVAKMVKLAREKCPHIFANAGPSCITEGICREHKSCGEPYSDIDSMLEEQIDQYKLFEQNHSKREEA